MKRFVIVVLTAVLLASMVSTVLSAQIKHNGDQCFVIESVYWKAKAKSWYGEEGPAFCGIVKNTAGYAWDVVTVECSLIDMKSGVKVGNTLSIIGNIAAGDKFEFVAPVSEEDMKKYAARVDKITGYQQNKP